jgi:hypothetical protein
MKFKLIILFIFLSSFSYSQLFVNTNKNYKFEFGIQPGGGALLLKDRITFEKDFTTVAEITPFVGFYPIKKINLSIGATGSYIFMKSNLIELPSLYSIGGYTKFVYPKTLKYGFFKKISFFTEFSYQIGNFLIHDSMPEYIFDDFTIRYPEKSSNLNYSSFYLTNGIMVDLGKGFNFNVYAQYGHFPQGQKKIIPRFSFSYMIRRKDPNALPDEDYDMIEEEKINKKDLPKEPNTHFLNSLVVGSSLTYIWNTNDDDYPVGTNLYEEYTWNLNVAVPLNKRFMVGAQWLNLFTKGTHVPDRNYMIYGLYTQYDFFAKIKSPVSMFLEMSINRGDYGTLGHLDPYRMKGLWYHGFGGGFEFPVRPISERLFFELSFQNYMILNKIQTKYNYTQYILGLNYRFGKSKK